MVNWFGRFAAVVITLLFVTAWINPVQDTPPDESRFTRVVLDNDLNEPMELDIAADGRIYYIERNGGIFRFDPKTNQKKKLKDLNVRFMGEDGLLGLALDPKFSQNRWVYLYYGNPQQVNGQWVNQLSRFDLSEDSLLTTTEKVMLQIPLLHEGVSHSAGSLEFDKQGNLYLSTGDNTNPFESDGYSPSDDRPGRIRFDAQKSSANTNDLRGKIIRIHPEPDGSYTIPAGNLFAKGLPNARPEIYTMGHRNPFRISIDSKTGYLYWGEVGPDAGTDSLMRGPRGHDEVGQARQAGNFGWPYFVGDNKPYYAYDFDAKKSGEPFNAKAPMNRSRNNTGLTILPPAQPAFIWYPYAESPEFPMLGTGGRNAMAGPVYHSEDYAASEWKFPSYFDNKLFIYDWMRNWIFTVTMNQNGDLQRLEPFMPSTEFNKPVDMVFGPDGALYMLEYGTYWRAKNLNAKLVRIEYHRGNRKPVARLSADKTVGGHPLTVKFSAAASFDYDKADKLRYEWYFTNSPKPQATGPEALFTFAKPGKYTPRVKVIDSEGNSSEARLPVQVGNEPPKVAIQLNGNRSFYWGTQPIPYTVSVQDREDGTLAKGISPASVRVTFDYLDQGYDQIQLAANTDEEPALIGKVLIERSDCIACHAKEKQSVGPSYVAIARRYGKDEAAVGKLASKIITGGGGNWDSGHVMSAHPQLSQTDAGEMVKYILSLGKAQVTIPVQGTVQTNRQPALATEPGTYLLTARYTDKGTNGIAPLTSRATVVLRSPRLLAASADNFKAVAKQNPGRPGQPVVMAYNESGAYIQFNNIDLTGVRKLDLETYTDKLTGQFEIHLNAPDGPAIGTAAVKPQKEYVTYTADLKPTTGEHTLFVVYRETKGGINIWNRVNLRWVEFKQ
ncbi:hypothetical protein GCM10023189_37110 [Nibrella saemangeumensis]|uniref:Cytochrome c n=1 Tax=Nibrella saemangeumensis TaxID=1084526 RepID=A0ABP8N9I4_9BACT